MKPGWQRMMKTDTCLVLSTAPSVVVARSIARVVLAKRLAACVHLAPRGESHYWWKGKLERAQEVAMTFKTSRVRAKALVRAVAEAHPYEVPEILVLRAAGGLAAYLRWIATETRPPGR